MKQRRKSSLLCRSRLSASCLNPLTPGVHTRAPWFSLLLDLHHSPKGFTVASPPGISTANLIISQPDPPTEPQLEPQLLTFGQNISSRLNQVINIWCARAWCPLKGTVNCHLVGKEEYSMSHVGFKKCMPCCLEPKGPVCQSQQHPVAGNALWGALLVVL